MFFAIGFQNSGKIRKIIKAPVVELKRYLAVKKLLRSIKPDVVIAFLKTAEMLFGCRKTANFLMYALENDKKYYCRVWYLKKVIHVECLIGSQLSERKSDHGWELPIKINNPNDIAAMCKKIAVLISQYTDNCFAPSAETIGSYRLKVTNAGIDTIRSNIVDRSKDWHKRFANNADVKDWCQNRIFITGYPSRITVRRKGLFLDRAVVIFNDEGYDNLDTRDELYGMALTIAEYSAGKYKIRLWEDQNGPVAIMDYYEQKKRKEW